VPVELNGTDLGGVPEDVPGLDPLRKAWGEIPWTRVAFSGEWVLEPRGRFLLSMAHCKHVAARSEQIGFGESFQQALEESLERHARIRSHPPGSPEERAEEERVAAEARADFEVRRECWMDVDRMTDHFVKTLRNQGAKQVDFESKYAVIIQWPEPPLRMAATAALGRYAERHDMDFATEAPLLSAEVAGLLDDEDPEVRATAARALFQFDRARLPDSTGEELVAAARTQWGSRERSFEVGAALPPVEDHLPALWPSQRVIKD